MYFEEHYIYHVFNRGIDRRQTFFTSRSYDYFLGKIKKEITPIADVLAFCLMPNHFHLLLRPSQKGCDYLSVTGEKTNAMQVLSKKLGVVLGSYTQGLNKHYGRTGSLWQQKTKAIELNRSRDAFQYLETCFHYIHQNPTRAGLVKKVNEWPYSSYNEFLHKSLAPICEVDIALSILNMTPIEFLFASRIVNEQCDLKRFLYNNSEPSA